MHKELERWCRYYIQGLTFIDTRHELHNPEVSTIGTRNHLIKINQIFQRKVYIIVNYIKFNPHAYTHTKKKG